MQRLDLPWSTPWVRWSLVLYLLARLSWLPVPWMEFRMRRIAPTPDEGGAPLPPACWRSFAVWAAAGTVGFGRRGAIFWLMVVKRLPAA